MCNYHQPMEKLRVLFHKETSHKLLIKRIKRTGLFACINHTMYFLCQEDGASSSTDTVSANPSGPLRSRRPIPSIVQGKETVKQV